MVKDLNEETAILGISEMVTSKQSQILINKYKSYF